MLQFYTSYSKQGDSDVNVAAITGGVVATVKILALTTVLVFLCLRYCYGPIPIKTLAKWAPSTFDRVLSRIVVGPSINTSNNAAYEDVDPNGGGQNVMMDMSQWSFLWQWWNQHISAQWKLTLQLLKSLMMRTILKRLLQKTSIVTDSRVAAI